jgi:hypothetical protein
MPECPPIQLELVQHCLDRIQDRLESGLPTFSQLPDLNSKSYEIGTAFTARVFTAYLAMHIFQRDCLRKGKYDRRWSLLLLFAHYQRLGFTPVHLLEMLQD